MIKNSVLYYGMPMTGKSTLLLRTYIHDYRKYKLDDLCINLWTFLHHDNKQAKTATLGYINSPNGRLGCLRIPYDPNGWLGAVSAYHARHPHIKRAMIDECQCVSPVYLMTLVMIIRDFYPKLPVIFTCIDYDSWHHKLPQIKALIKLVPQSHHLHHRCMLCHRIATRRLHVVNHKPCYDEDKYNKILKKHAYTKDGRPDMYSVCSRHYRHLPKGFEKIMKRRLQPSQSRVKRAQEVRKHLGLNPNVKIRFTRAPRKRVVHRKPVRSSARASRNTSGTRKTTRKAPRSAKRKTKQSSKSNARKRSTKRRKSARNNHKASSKKSISSKK